MISLTYEEARRLIAETNSSVHVSDDGAFPSIDTTVPGFYVRAPVSLRSAIAFVATLARSTPTPQLRHRVIWFTRTDVGGSGAPLVGWKVIESLRRSSGDARSLDIAPAQLFRENEDVELQVFLFQAVTFGWTSYFLPLGVDCLVNFRSSQRWFFHCKEQSTLDLLLKLSKSGVQCVNSTRTRM